MFSVAPKGKFDSSKGKQTATSYAPKSISQQPHVLQQMCYTSTQIEAAYLLTENVEIGNKNGPALFWINWGVFNEIAIISFCFISD